VTPTLSVKYTAAFSEDFVLRSDDATAAPKKWAELHEVIQTDAV
jgi:hypothetical protein